MDNCGAAPFGFKRPEPVEAPDVDDFFVGEIHRVKGPKDDWGWRTPAAGGDDALAKIDRVKPREWSNSVDNVDTRQWVHLASLLWSGRAIVGAGIILVISGLGCPPTER